MNCVLGAGFAELDINIDDRVNLSYANLSAMDLAGAHLNQSDLQGCNLTVEFDGAYLRSAWLMASHLNGPTLRMQIHGAVLTEADLTGAI